MDRYEELLSRAKDHYCNKGLTLEEYELLEKLFPEIKQSSDEKIRKALLSMVHDTTSDEIYEYKITKKEALAWLEKQKPAATPIEGEFPYTEPSSTLDGEIKNIWNKLSFHGEFTAAESGFSEVIHHFANWLEKQGKNKGNNKLIWKHCSNGIAGNGDGEPIYLIKTGNTYSLSSCLGFECDYIELSELDNLMLEKQGEPVEINPTEFDTRLQTLIGKFDTLPKEELIGSLSFWLNVVQNDGTYKPDEKQGEQKNKINSYKITFEDVLALECSMKTAKITEGGDKLYELLVPLYNKIHKAYLDEKQGGQKPADKEESKFHEGDLIRLKDGDGLEWTIKEMHHDGYYTIVCEDREDFIYLDNRWELVGKLVDMNEPKFHEGDWVVDNECGKVNQITSVRSKGYDFANGDYMSYESAHKELRLWDISDAKDGDILVHNSITFIFMGIENGIVKGICTELDDTILNFGEPEYDNDYCPATKEQRDTLMKAMADTGYTFDFEKKELKKIGPIDEYEGLTDFERTLADICIGWIGKEIGWKEYIKDNADVLLKIAIEKFNSVQDASFEQKPAWSEEDEKFFKTALWHISYSISNGESSDIQCDTTEWFKSLKDRYTWKPSKEQIMALRWVLNHIPYDSHKEEISGLLEQLKKLTE